MRNTVVNIIAFFIMGLSITAASCSGNKEQCAGVVYDAALTLPPLGDGTPNIGVAGAYAGMVDGKLFVAGGANFPDGFPWTGATKVWHTVLYVYDFDGVWSIYDDFLPEPLGYGASVPVDGGFLMIGGNNSSGPVNDVRFVTVEDGKPVIDNERYPAMPVPLSNMAAAKVGNKVFIAGGVTCCGPEESTHTFLMLDLDDLAAGWKDLPAWPGASLGYAVAAGCGNSFYLFSGRTFGPGAETIRHTEGFRFDADTQEWTLLQGEFPFMAGTAVEHNGKIWFMGGVSEILPTTPDHPGFPRTVCAYDPATGKLETVSESPYPIAVTTTAVDAGDGKVIIASGEEKPGVRTPLLLQVEINE